LLEDIVDRLYDLEKSNPGSKSGQNGD